MNSSHRSTRTAFTPAPHPEPSPDGGRLPPDRRPPFAGRIIKFILNGLFGLSILVFIFLAYGNLPNRWYHILYIDSGSMAPTIQPGDLILITPPPAVLKPGMILTMSVNGSLVTHRLVGFGEYGELITRGDANSVVDDWDDASVSVVGLYRARIPYLGYLAAIPGRFTGGLYSGAWFTAAESISGELGTHTGWATPAPPKKEIRLRGSLAASPFYEDGRHGIDLRLCLLNSGSDRVEGLHVLNILQASLGNEPFRDVTSQFLDIRAHPSLELGEEHCYEARIPIEPLEGARYRDQVKVILLQAAAEPGGASLSQEDPLLVALELEAAFSLVEPPAVTATPTTTPAIPLTPTPVHTPSPTATAPVHTPSPTATQALSGSPEHAPEEQPATPTPAPNEGATASPTGNLPAAPTHAPTELPSQPPPPSRSCVYPPDYWLEHPGAWPVDLINLGEEELDRREALDLLALDLLQEDPQQDVGLELARAAIPAWLNLFAGAYTPEALDAIVAAEAWFLEHPSGTPVSESDALQAEHLAGRLEAFSQGLSGLPLCPPEENPPSATPTAPAAATATAAVTAAPTATPTAPAPGSTPTAAGLETAAPLPPAPAWTATPTPLPATETAADPPTPLPPTPTQPEPPAPMPPTPTETAAPTPLPPTPTAEPTSEPVPTAAPDTDLDPSEPSPGADPTQPPTGIPPEDPPEAAEAAPASTEGSAEAGMESTAP